MSETQYSITFQNQSTNYGNVCIYQTDPNLGPDVMSLAWLAKSISPNTEVTFDWTVNYGFVWDETGVLVPGVVFHTSQLWDADFEKNNKVSFSMINDTYSFSNLTRGDYTGALIIEENDTIPLKRAAVGISMSGSAVFIKEAHPNTTLAVSPHTEYWITFGNFQQGEVINDMEITNKQKVEFEPGVFSKTVIMNIDNTLSIK